MGIVLCLHCPMKSYSYDFIYHSYIEYIYIYIYIDIYMIYIYIDIDIYHSIYSIYISYISYIIYIIYIMTYIYHIYHLYILYIYSYDFIYHQVSSTHQGKHPDVNLSSYCPQEPPKFSAPTPTLSFPHYTYSFHSSQALIGI